MEFDKSEKITALTLRLVKKLVGEAQPENHVNRMSLFNLHNIDYSACLHHHYQIHNILVYTI